MPVSSLSSVAPVSSAAPTAKFVETAPSVASVSCAARSSGTSPPPRLLRVGLLGHGRVGRAVCDLIAAEHDALARRHGIDLRVTTAFVRDAVRPRDGVPPGARVVDDAEAFLAAPHDVVVEVLGGTEPAAALVEALLARGTPVVTANKHLLAEHGPRLASVAAASGAALRFEASVAAGVPLFSLLERSLRTTRIARVAGVLNGTSNFVLSRLARGGTTVAAALDEARRLGLAETDASLDLRGTDAAHKLRVLALAAAGRELPARAVEVRGIERVRSVDCARAAAVGHRLKPVAWAALRSTGHAGTGPERGAGDAALAERDPDEGRSEFRPHGWVAPAAVEDGHPLASVEGAQSGVLLTGDTVADLFVAGPGAGPVPTAASIVDDLLAVANDRGRPGDPENRRSGDPGFLPAPQHRGGRPGNPGIRESGDPGIRPLPAAGAPRVPADGSSAAPTRAASRWLVAFAADASTRAGTDEILRFLAEHAVTFRRLREIDEPEGPVVVGITPEAAPDAIERVGTGLRTVGAVHEWTAFRVVESHLRGGAR